MSLSQVFTKRETDDHLFIPRHIARYDTEYGGWDEWAAGCICGWYIKSDSRWYIPAEVSALRLWKSHAGIEDKVTTEEEE